MNGDVVERAIKSSRDPQLFRALLAAVRRNVGFLSKKPILMEVCGSHTWAISHTGIRELLKDEVELISGPGCPVCVTSPGEVAQMIELSHRPGVIVTSYGDMIRVPGRGGSLEASRAAGNRVEVVYSAMDAVTMAENNPEQQVVFVGIGFETTAPATAVAVELAKARGLGNFAVYSAHKLMPPALRAILGLPDLNIDGLILPGHVSAVTGRKYFDFISDYPVPAVISGFEACDILYAILKLVKKICARDFSVENAYPRAVRETGNTKAMAEISKVFRPSDAFWRGLGNIPLSGLELKAQYSAFDAKVRFGLPRVVEEPEPPGCCCAEVLSGRKTPRQCRLFGKICTPSSPVGPCMVSSEGSCRAHYVFGR